jgi:hypothetical protein
MPVVLREVERGRESEAWYARRVFVPRDKLASNVSAPPNAFRMCAVTLCRESEIVNFT